MDLLRRYLLDNLSLKLGSIALAAVLWSLIANEPPVEVAFQPVLEFRNMPQHLELSTEAPSSVLVRVRGPGSVVRQLSPRDLAVSLNLAEFDRPGERSYLLSVSDVKTPSGVRVVQIVPAQVRVRFEARLEREIPITPRIVGQFVPRYQLAGYQVLPPTVRVVGPESHVAPLESVATDPVEISGVIARAQFWVNAVVPDPLVRIQGQPSVMVTIQMERRR